MAIWWDLLSWYRCHDAGHCVWYKTLINTRPARHSGDLSTVYVRNCYCNTYLIIPFTIYCCWRWQMLSSGNLTMNIRLHRPPWNLIEGVMPFSCNTHPAFSWCQFRHGMLSGGGSYASCESCRFTRKTSADLFFYRFLPAFCSICIYLRWANAYNLSHFYQSYIT